MTETSTEAIHYIVKDGTGALLNKKVIDEKKFDKCLNEGYLADCCLGSMRLYLKLEKIGVRRMRGKRVSERIHGGWHYWVENDKCVYDEHGGLRQIFDREGYYKIANISDAEQTTINMFFEDEFEKGDKVARKLRRDLESGNPNAIQFRHEIVKKMSESEDTDYNTYQVDKYNQLFKEV
jgi:hypothetical protein